MTKPFLNKPMELELTQEMTKLVQQAEQGDTTVLPALRKLLTEKPQLWVMYGDLAAWAERSWLDLIAGPNLVLRESLERKLQQLREELGEPSASPLDDLLVRRAVSCWLEVHYADVHLAQLHHQNANATQLRVVERFLTSSHHRYLSAIRQLAQVRKLLRPALSPLDLATTTIHETRPSSRQRRVS